MKKDQGKKTIHVEVPAHLHNMLSKLSVDVGLSVTAIITKYLEYLDAKHYRKRDILHEDSASDFSLDDGATKKLSGANKPKQK